MMLWVAHVWKIGHLQRLKVLKWEVGVLLGGFSCRTASLCCLQLAAFDMPEVRQMRCHSVVVAEVLLSGEVP